MNGTIMRGTSLQLCFLSWIVDSKYNRDVIEPERRIDMDNLDASEQLIILVFIFCRWHLIARTMPTLTVIKHTQSLSHQQAGIS